MRGRPTTSLAEVLRDVPNSVRVEGHTDNVPIATATFPSNWELSAGRAASVVHLFAVGRAAVAAGDGRLWPVPPARRERQRAGAATATAG